MRGPNLPYHTLADPSQWPLGHPVATNTHLTEPPAQGKNQPQTPIQRSQQLWAFNGANSSGYKKPATNTHSTEPTAQGKIDHQHPFNGAKQLWAQRPPQTPIPRSQQLRAKQPQTPIPRSHQLRAKSATNTHSTEPPAQGTKSATNTHSTEPTALGATASPDTKVLGQRNLDS